MRYTMRHMQTLLVFSLLHLLSYVCADIGISLLNTTNGSTDFKKYSRIEFFSYMYANTNGTMRGFFHQPTPINGCSYISPLPNPYPMSKDNQSGIWIALIQDYPDCLDDMVYNVRNAGYRLLVTSNANNSNLTLTAHTKNLAFPIIVIQDHYMNYLVTTALSKLDSPEILATVTTGIDTFVATFVIGFGFLLVTCCFLCFSFCFCRSYRRRQRERAMFDYETRNLEQRRRNYSNYQARDQMARQELIESILRQLQQLQLEGQLQTPLGAERTKQLPIKKFEKSIDGSSQGETCAICVDDLKVGETLRVLPCQHHFHQNCIDEWLINHSDLCPLCKKQVPRGDSPEQPQGRRGGERRFGGRGHIGIGAGPREDQLVLFTDDDSDETESSEGTNDGRTRSSLLVGMNRERRYGSL